MVGTRHEDAGAHQLEQQAWGGGAAEVDERGVDDLGRASELRRSEPGRLATQALGPVARHLEQARGQRVGDGGDDDEVAQALEQVLGEPARILAGLDDLVDDTENRGPVADRECIDGLVEQGVGRVAEQLHREVVGDAVGTGTAEQLVEDAEGVAHGPGPGTHHERQGVGLEIDALALAQSVSR